MVAECLGLKLNHGRRQPQLSGSPKKKVFRRKPIRRQASPSRARMGIIIYIIFFGGCGGPFFCCNRCNLCNRYIGSIFLIFPPVSHLGSILRRFFLGLQFKREEYLVR